MNLTEFSTENSTGFSMEIYVEKQGGNITFKKNSMGKGLSLLNRHYKVVVIKAVWYWLKDRQIYPWNETELSDPIPICIWELNPQ